MSRPVTHANNKTIGLNSLVPHIRTCDETPLDATVWLVFVDPRPVRGVESEEIYNDSKKTVRPQKEEEA